MIQGQQVACRRASARLNSNGIVALTGNPITVITKLNDITPDGLSFLHQDKWSITSDELVMDILLLDGLTDNDCFLNQIRGRIRSTKALFTEHPRKMIWRYGIEFININDMHRDQLKRYIAKKI